ncbi:MAG: hypothetical protein KJO02_02655 [Erythrobacter sp.]|jgi:hypothetical protein|nr:hypothetical protein [Erythrobacter sp.]
MKKYISASSALLVTAMMVTLSFGCGDGTGGDTGYAEAGQMQTTDGTCNAIAARSLKTAQECYRSRACEPGSAECNEALEVLGELFGDEYCGPAMLNDELNGLPTGNPINMPEGSSRPGEPKHLQEVLCTAISDCGACPALPPTFCPEIC